VRVFAIVSIETNIMKINKDKISRKWFLYYFVMFFKPLEIPKIISPKYISW